MMCWIKMNCKRDECGKVWKDLDVWGMDFICMLTTRWHESHTNHRTFKGKSKSSCPWISSHSKWPEWKPSACKLIRLVYTFPLHQHYHKRPFQWNERSPISTVFHIKLFRSKDPKCDRQKRDLQKYICCSFTAAIFRKWWNSIKLI